MNYPATVGWGFPLHPPRQPVQRIGRRLSVTGNPDWMLLLQGEFLDIDRRVDARDHDERYSPDRPAFSQRSGLRYPHLLHIFEEGSNLPVLRSLFKATSIPIRRADTCSTPLLLLLSIPGRGFNLSRAKRYRQDC